MRNQSRPSLAPCRRGPSSPEGMEEDPRGAIIVMKAKDQRGNVTPRDQCARYRPVFRCVALSLLACHALHIMSSCAFHLHTCSSSSSEYFPRCPFCNPTLLSPLVVLSTFLSCAGVKHFRIGPRLVMQPWFTIGRPPVKFCAIWTSFDTPTVNRGTEKASCVLQPNTLPKWPKTHLNLLHHLDRSITIAWPKTAPHLDSPSSLYL